MEKYTKSRKRCCDKLLLNAIEVGSPASIYSFTFGGEAAGGKKMATNTNWEIANVLQQNAAG
jgi:hypothetical protein